MKKLIFCATALLSMLFSACQQETIEAIADGATVNFAVEVPGEIGTKAIADGENVDVLFYAVYRYGDAKTDLVNGVENEASSPLAAGYVNGQNKVFNVTFDLLMDQEYVAIFWAQVGKEQNHYAWPENGDLRLIKYADPNGAQGNLEERAAFFRTYIFDTKEANDHKVMLYRPFAQLNLGSTLESLQPTQTGLETLDYVIDVQKSQVKVTGLSKSFNTIAGLGVDEYCGEATPASTEDVFVFKMHDVLTEGTIAVTEDREEYLVVSDKAGNPVKYEWVAMNYFFANGNVTVEYDIETDKGTVNNTVTNVPVMENFRTNIIGNLLTSKTDFEIVVDERFEQPQPDINVTIPRIDYVVNGDVYEVYTAEGLAKFAYMVNYVDNTLCLEVMADIQLPMLEIEPDHENQTYVYTNVPIKVENGIPSGSNWVTIGEYDLRDHNAKNYFSGWVNGNGYTVSGLRIKKATAVAGFIGYVENDGVVVSDLNMKDAVVYNETDYAAALMGWVGYGVVVRNCHLTNVHIKGGNNFVGGIASYSVTRDKNSGLKTAVIEGCSIDATSTVEGRGYVGGIVGRNYGSIVKTSYSAATVDGLNLVGGITGQNMDYFHNQDGLIIACVNDGIITGDSNVGGITGCSEEIKDLVNAQSYIVASCTRASEADYTNIIAGNAVRCVANYGSWGLKTKADQQPLPAGTYTACYAYDSAAAITQADVDAMNAAIDEYNTGRTADDPTYCAYKWAWTEGNLPELVLM